VCLQQVVWTYIQNIKAELCNLMAYETGQTL
jgi:hypothetical protein